MSVVFMYITAGSRDEAVFIGRTLVGERLAACANVLPEVTSIFRWDGAVQEEAEVSLILKTRTDLVDAVTARVAALHSYDCPCVVALSVIAGNEAFIEWIAAETAAEDPV